MESNPNDPQQQPPSDPPEAPASPASAGEPLSPDITQAATPVAKKKRKTGFATMDPALVKAMASKGGKAAHVKGTAHEFTSAEAREAGKKGGTASHAKKKSAI